MPGFIADLSISDLQRATRLAAEKHLELQGQGYHPRLIEGGITRAWGMADFHTRALSPGLRGPAFVEWLQVELVGVSDWIDKQVAGYAR